MKTMTPLEVSTFSLDTLASGDALAVNCTITPKSACSTLKASLLGSAPDLDTHSEDWQLSFNQWHGVFVRRFCRSQIDTRKPFLVLSRNPYERVISAYLDKIGKGRDIGVWLPFCQRYGTSLDDTPTFSEFLAFLAQDETAHQMDVHFRPQYFTNNAKFLHPRFIGRVEDMSNTAAFLKLNDVDLIEYRPHSRRIRFDRADLSTAQARTIQHIYAIDFEHYGYDPEPLSHYVPEPVLQEQEVSPELESIAHLRGSVDAATLISKAASILPSGALDVAESLLRRALMLDPSSSVALRSLEEVALCVSDRVLDRETTEKSVREILSDAYHS